MNKEPEWFQQVLDRTTQTQSIFTMNNKQTNKTTMTQLQKAMLKDIQEGENDGIGMGYSEFDGVGLTPLEKGVLGSLVAEGYVYNSATGWEDSDFMYCSTSKAPRLID